MKSLLLPAVICLAATAASAQDLETWGEVENWVIQIDPAVGNGCLMATTHEDGTLVQFGNVPARKGGFFAAYNENWTEIEDGAVSTVKFDFDKKRFSGEAVSIARDGVYGGYAFFDNPNVPMEFAKNTTMTVITETGQFIVVDLSGTTKAIAAVQACQAEQTDKG